ncbi:MAG TPA: GntR family transcriptional regulator [Victivallales bacterium]|nr:GntR family transcriptional regulator [Victivallales bacterium]
MDFKDKQTISTQISEYVSDNIINGIWNAGDRLPSVREYASEVEVNVNTILKSYNQLELDGIIVKKRGIGYFVTENAQKIIEDEKRKEFIRYQLPEFLKVVKMLNLTLNDLKPYFKTLELTGEKK